MSRRARVAVLGGTFDRLHAGHRALLDRAFRVAESVGIGLTTPSYLRRHPKSRRGAIGSYGTRRASLGRYLRQSHAGREFWIVPLRDGFGGSVEPGVDVLVASEESRMGARAVNVERRRRGLPPVRLVLVPVVRGDDFFPISSSRIRAGEVDPAGHRRTRLRIGVAGVDPRSGASVSSALRAVFQRAGPVELVFRRSGAQRDARNARATAIRRAASSVESAGYGVGVARAGAGPGGFWIALSDDVGPRGTAARIDPPTSERVRSELRRMLNQPSRRE